MVAAALALAPLLGIIDALTGFEISFSFFYLLPVALAAWAAGRRAGTFMAALCAIIWLVANQLAGEAFSAPGVAFWNTITRFGFFVVVAILLSEFRRLLRVERGLARSDQLTGLLNKRVFYDIVEAELDRSRRYPHTLTLLYLDLDNFKEYNDSRGHEAGDRQLTRVASAIRASVRAVDSVARLGGDEFGVLLPETDQVAARALGDRLLEALRTPGADGSPSLTASIGAVTCRVLPESVGELVAAADALMYEVKRSTRDDVRYLEYAGPQAG